MKAYGKPRSATAKRNIRGTSRACPCCIPRGSYSKPASKSYKAKMRLSVLLTI